MSDRQHLVCILALMVLGATLGISLGIWHRYGFLSFAPVPVAAVVVVEAFRQRMFILMDGKKRFLTGVWRGLVHMREFFHIQVMHIDEIVVEDSTAKLTAVKGPEAGREGMPRKFHVIGKGRAGSHLLCSTSSQKNATLVAYAVSRTLGKELSGCVDLSHWRRYIEALEEEEKKVLKKLLGPQVHRRE